MSKSGITYPLVFENNNLKKEMNLRVLKKAFPEQILDYSLVIPKCSIYQVNENDQWEKIDIFGSLFVLSVSETPMPVIIILNAQSFARHQNFHLIVNSITSCISHNGNKVFIKLLDRSLTYCISTNSNDDALNLLQALSCASVTTFSDPTVQHLIRSFGTRF